MPVDRAFNLPGRPLLADQQCMGCAVQASEIQSTATSDILLLRPATRLASHLRVSILLSLHPVALSVTIFDARDALLLHGYRSLLDHY